MILEPGKKIFFASDFHLGVPSEQASVEREKKIISWLNSIEKDAQEIYLIGDVFDFWFEYKKVIPKGFVRLQSKIAQLCDNGIKVHYFTGNHDMWVFEYFSKELGVKMHYKEIEIEINSKKFFIAHGDGLGPGDNGYKFIKKVFSNPVCKFLFRWIHPDLGIALADFWSGKSRSKNGPTDEIYLGKENEWLAIFCKEKLKEKYFNYFIFGHRHLVIDIEVGDNSRYINLGDWFKSCNYAIFDGENLILKEYII
ncbi:MAG: UDP-2,3-diacylglucosamine diphosphatase [Bacteroidota bacterium]